ncbi:MAG: hypothetical protein MT490_19430 [Sphingomonas sp.]|uniref:hypothetical protein n=1 Tax=Sphingomonas sp. TaxID=28214 RepID=UPI002272546E|nr:hypothetical protein [Sphingomonas sp.]MCX8477967.1 hypothetical protein [Sphingomonas sp.]
MSAAAAEGRIQQESFRTILRRTALLIGILMSGGHLFFPRLPMFGVILVIFLLYRDPAQLLRRELASIWWLLLAVLVMALIGGGGISAVPFANRYANFFAGMFLLGIYMLEPRKSIIDDLVIILRLMAIQAILTVIIAFIFPSYFGMLIYGDTAYRTIFLLFTYHDVLAVSSRIKRADGFFFEPGVYHIYLNIFLYIVLFLRKNVRDVALAVIGVVATQSTMGFAVTAFLLTAAYTRGVQTVHISAKLVVAMFVPLLILPVMWIGYNNYIDKTQGALRGSAWAREYDLYTGLRIIAEYPLTGIGFDLDRYAEAAQRFGYRGTQLDLNSAAERVSSNGVITLAFMVGLPLFFVFVIGLFRQRFFPNRFIFGTALLMCFLTEALMLTPFFLMIMFSGLLNAASPRLAIRGMRVAQGPRAARVPVAPAE